MAKNSIRDYDSSSSNNSDVQSVDISEGCSPSGINNAIREVMADLADVNDGTVALESPKFDSIKDGNIKPPDASGTDVAGTATTIKGGAGTGTGAGGSIVFQTADGGSTGSSVNAHATAMTITDDGYVGIGTTSPATATGNGLDIEAAGGASVRLDDTTNTVTGELQVYSSGMNLVTTTNHDIIFSPNNTEAMRINNDGIVTHSAKPFVSVDCGGGAYISVASGAAIPFDTVFQGDSSLWDTSAYEFTCPVAGLYLMTFTGLTSPAAAMTISFEKNNTSIMKLLRASERGIDGSYVVECAANDTLRWVNSLGVAQVFYHGNGTVRYTSGTITLLG